MKVALAIAATATLSATMESHAFVPSATLRSSSVGTQRSSHRATSSIVSMQASSARGDDHRCGDEPMDRRSMLQSAALSALGAVFVTSASPVQTWAANLDYDKVCVVVDLCA